jgi:multiple sugar transport system ATP-binding protein
MKDEIAEEHMANIELKDIWKSYKEVQALQGLELSTNEGELFCLLGPSGAGKTTTLRMIAGVEEPDKGDILLDGESIVNLMPRERDIALAFESYALYPQMTVYENLLFPMQAPVRKNDMTDAEKKERIEWVANLLNISELLQRLPKELSGGQRQRVGLGRVLVRKPKVYLLDEPISHLDAKLRHRMRIELKKIQKELGVTTIYSTPDQLEALSMADKIAVINHGRIEQLGTAEDVYNNPENVFVARFVGDPPMNILESAIEANKFVVDCDVNFQFPVPSDAPDGINGKVLVGIRPKDVTLSQGESDKAHTKGRIIDVDTLGQTTVVTAEVGCLHVKVKTSTAEAPERDSLVSLTLDSTRLHYFDPETEVRIS